MSGESRICLTILIVLSNSLRINGRCGYPELPFMSASIETKEFFEEGETLTVRCIGGVVIGQRMNEGLIQCSNNTWNTTLLRCSQVHNITAIDIIINGKQQETSDLKKQEFIYLSDNNPMTCVSLRDEEQWILHLDSDRYVSNVAIIATFIDDKMGNNATNIAISLSNKQMCQLEESTNNPNSPIVFLIYKCPNDILTENVSIHLQANGNYINICDIDIFTINDEDCGKPELPLYSFANQMKIQNGTKIVEYICAKGYKLNGSSLRSCGRDGLWYPSKAPTCLPKVKCDPFLEKTNFTLEYKNFDAFGNAVPEVSTLIYHCLNETEIISQRTVRYCKADGSWSPIKHTPVCHPRNHLIIVFGRHITRDKNLIYYGVAGLTLLFAGSAIILCQMRRLAKRISKQMRENSYLEQEKAFPNYNNDSNYHDVFSTDSNNLTQTLNQPQIEQKF